MTGWTHEYAFPIPAPPERIFRALTETSELEQWFAEYARVEPKVGGAYAFWGRFTVGTPAESDATGTVVAIDAGERLAFTWELYGVPGTVTISLAPEQTERGPGTKVSIAHAVGGELNQPRPKELVDDWWRFVLGNLASHAAGHGEVLRVDFADPSPEVRISMTMDASPDRIFRALIEPEALNQWFAKDAKVEPRVGGRFDLGWAADEDVEHAGPAMEILEFVENEKLTIQWPDWRGDVAVPPQRVTWLLEPTDEGTRVTLVHAGFTRPVDVSDYPFGWQHFLSEMGKVAVGLAAV